VDSEGNTILAGVYGEDRRPLEVVMALDDPEYVITVFGEVE
jgi:hypothetical protein